MLRGAVLAIWLALSGTAQAACPMPPRGAAAADEVLKRTNAFRLSHGRTRVAVSAALAEAAQVQACHMAATGRMSHGGAGGSSVGDRATAEGYRWGFIAENVAAGHPTAKAVFRGWRSSPGHRQNLLARDAREIGIGVAVADGRLYWAMVMGKPLR